MRDRSGDYTRMVHNVRLTRETLARAQRLQRKGYTLNEIAKYTHIDVKPITQSLYWEVVLK